jgi:glycine/D-amino acid oxidase-like deaminating enzyme
MTAPFPLAPALWAATAAAPIAAPPLTESRKVDVCVVGAGYAGLSTALHLAEKGISVVVLEAREPGWGASGRNGGQVIPGLKYDPDEILALYGPEQGEKLLEFAAGTADCVFDLIARHNMDVPRVRTGWIQAAHSEEGLGVARRRAAQWARRGVAARLLDATEAAEHLGTPGYRGGWLDPRGGAIQPLSYARGLAQAAEAAGASIHGQSTVTAIEPAKTGWNVITASGASVRADKVIVCTNAYDDRLVAGLDRSILAMNSFQVATAPLSDNLAKTILPHGQVVSDTRKLLLYFRLDHEGRLLLGGRGPFREPKGAADWSHLERVVGKLFPQIAGTPIAYRWGGRVAITFDHMPHLHEPAPGLIIDIGCMGRGIGLQTAMGRALAAYAASGSPDVLPLALKPVRPFPFHAFRRLGLAAVIALYRMQDGGVKQV